MAKQPVAGRSRGGPKGGNNKANEPSKTKTSKPRAPRRPKKTLEELDAEMEDYFENKA